MPTKNTWGTLAGGFAAAVLLFALLSGPPPASQAAPENAAAPKWEYNSVTAEANAVQAKLGELALDGWEVFSIVREEMSIAPGGNGKTRLVSDTYRITGRRLFRR